MKHSTAVPFVFSLMISVMSTMSFANQQTTPQANIQLKLDTNMVTVRPCLNSAPKEQLRYELSALRIGSNGSSRSSQSGYFNPTENVCPSTMRVSFKTGDKAFFVLRIYQQQNLINEVILDYPEPKFETGH